MFWKLCSPGILGVFSLEFNLGSHKYVLLHSLGPTYACISLLELTCVIHFYINELLIFIVGVDISGI